MDSVVQEFISWAMCASEHQYFIKVMDKSFVSIILNRFIVLKQCSYHYGYIYSYYSWCEWTFSL